MLNRNDIRPTHQKHLKTLSNRLRRWAELECGTSEGHIEQDETGQWVKYDSMQQNRRRIADQETPTKAEINKIVDRYEGLAWYHQNDPRGAQVYLYRVCDLGESRIDSVYSSIGVAF
jgi:hypothetical protein